MSKAILILTKNDTFFNFIKEILLEVFENNTITIQRNVAQNTNRYIYIYI